MAVGERAGWRYLHEGCNCDPLCTESREDKPKTLSIFLYATECTVRHWIQACATKSYYHARRVIFSAKGIPCKDLHTSTFPRERAECNSLFYFCVGESSSTLQTPCHTHTYKAYFYIICFKLCVMTMESELTTEQAT